MKKLKWKTQGIEFDKNYTNFCNKKLKLNIINKNFLSFKPTRKFDLITFNKVLEHIANPRQLLKHATSLLNKNGVVYVEVPDSRVKKLGKFRDELNPAISFIF